jgi:hypothetical protein
MNDPSQISTSDRTSPAHSMRSRRTCGTWARPRGSDDGYSRLVVDIHTEIIPVREKNIFITVERLTPLFFMDHGLLVCVHRQGIFFIC